MQNCFQSTGTYIADQSLTDSVNIAAALERPLLIKGEPGTGKTMLAQAVAEALGMELITWNIKSTTKAQDGLYTYDTIKRLYDSQFGEEGVNDISRYIRLGRLGEAFTRDSRTVLLIDEIDKADLEFPNDLIGNWIGWNSISRKPALPYGQKNALSSSSPPTRKKNCRMHFYGAASFITLISLTRPC